MGYSSINSDNKMIVILRALPPNNLGKKQQSQFWFMVSADIVLLIARAQLNAKMLARMPYGKPTRF